MNVSRVVYAVAAAVALITRASALHGQTLSVATNNLTANVPVTVGNLQSNGNLGTTLAAGSVTLNIKNCKNADLCRISIFAASAPTAGTVRLNWSVPANAGTGGTWGSCTGGSGQVTTTPTEIFRCTSGANSDRNGIVVTFTYPVTWNTTVNGSHATQGITFRFHVNN